MNYILVQLITLTTLWFLGKEKVKRQHSEWEKIIANEATDKQLISKKYKHEFSKVADYKFSQLQFNILTMNNWKLKLKTPFTIALIYKT